jgi:hypothetical protein
VNKIKTPDLLPYKYDDQKKRDRSHYLNGHRRGVNRKNQCEGRAAKGRANIVSPDAPEVLDAPK